MINIAKKLRNVIYLLFGIRTWQNMEYFDFSWSKRIKEMAKYVSKDRSVLDLGCGKMWARQYLYENPYYPVDYTYRGEGTIICDFNKKQFPEQKADIAFVSGTLEYIMDTNWFLFNIANNCNECVISYCTLEDHPDMTFRHKQAWVNHYSRDEIIQIFLNVGFYLNAENTNIPKNRIFYFKKVNP